MSPTLTPQSFVNKWRAAEQKERSVAQSHFNDLCELIDHPKPLDVDSSGAWFAFEKGANKSIGKDGFADVWKRGYFAWEYKGKHGNLDKAYQQLLLYHESLEQPPLLVVCDINTIVIHTKFTNTVKRTITITLDDLLTPSGMRHLRDLFTAPDSFRAEQTTEQVTRTAAAKFAELAEHLRQRGEEAEATAHFLIRLLFCLFAEDIDLLPSKLFSKLIELGIRRPEQFGPSLAQLFGAMATGGLYGSEEIRHFNGGLFDDTLTLPLGHAGLRILQEIATLDWSSIEPSILGTLFERSLDPSKRSQLGAHYTSRDDILLLVEPLLMAPLRRQWAATQRIATELASRRDSTRDAGQRTRRQGELSSLLVNFVGQIASTRVLDPACGSGNFLYVALRQLLDLEKEVSQFASTVGLPGLLPQSSPAQLYGIELNEYAHELAQATVWIGYIQWLHENGYGTPSEPILKQIDNIRQMDAILAFDAAGNPIEPEWPQAEVIVGNPPFLGGGKVRSELGDMYVENLFALYGSKLPNFSDLVCYWYEKSRQMVEVHQVKRVGLLATNSIRGGANRTVLERIKSSGDIFWAISDRKWVLEGASVRVSMIGFDDGTESSKTLDFEQVSAINADLTSAVDVTRASLLKENVGICYMGASPKGPFDIEESIAIHFLQAPLNVNGRPNSDVVRPVLSGIDLVRRSREKWTIDFGLLSEEDSAFYELPFEYVKRVVYPIRSQNRRASYANKWWQYAEARPGMRNALAKLTRHIATPEVSVYRLYVWVDARFLCNQQVLVFARNDDYFFGVLHSRFNEIWALKQGTSLGATPRYTPSTTFETYPFPWPPGHEPVDDPRVAAIAQAAHDLHTKRAAWLNPPGLGEAELKKRTLTNLYNSRPTWLDLAHKRLDAAVAAAYGWPATLPDEEVLARLLALNLERAAGKGEGE
jgi:hypothetical protein